jgi:hypothetical protein
MSKILTAHLFRPLSSELGRLLRGLEPGDWARPTSAAAWSVRDVAAHLLDIELRRISIVPRRSGWKVTPLWPRRCWRPGR